MVFILKRNHKKDTFQPEKIAIAIKKGFDSIQNDHYSEADVFFVYQQVLNQIDLMFQQDAVVSIEQIQDIIEKQLIKHRYQDVYESFSSYRKARHESRQIFISKQHKLLKVIEKVSYTHAFEPYLAHQKLVEFGKNISKEFAQSYLISQQHLSNHDQGRFFIQHLETYPMKSIHALTIDVAECFKQEIKTDTYTLLKLSTFSVCMLVNQLYQETLATLILVNFERVLKALEIAEFIQYFQLNPQPLIIQLNDVSSNQAKELLENPLSSVQYYVNSTKDYQSAQIFNQAQALNLKLNRAIVNVTSLNLTRLSYLSLNQKELALSVRQLTQSAIEQCIDRFEFQVSKSGESYPLLLGLKLFNNKKDALKKFFIDGVIYLDLVGLSCFSDAQCHLILKNIHLVIKEYQSPQIPQFVVATLFNQEAKHHFLTLDRSIYGELVFEHLYDSFLTKLYQFRIDHSRQLTNHLETESECTLLTSNSVKVSL